MPTEDQSAALAAGEPDRPPVDLTADDITIAPPPARRTQEAAEDDANEEVVVRSYSTVRTLMLLYGMRIGPVQVVSHSTAPNVRQRPPEATQRRLPPSLAASLGATAAAQPTGTGRLCHQPSEQLASVYNPNSDGSIQPSSVPGSTSRQDIALLQRMQVANQHAGVSNNHGANQDAAGVMSFMQRAADQPNGSNSHLSRYGLLPGQLQSQGGLNPAAVQAVQNHVNAAQRLSVPSAEHSRPYQQAPPLSSIYGGHVAQGTGTAPQHLPGSLRGGGAQQHGQQHQIGGRLPGLHRPGSLNAVAPPVSPTCVSL